MSWRLNFDHHSTSFRQNPGLQTDNSMGVVSFVPRPFCDGAGGLRSGAGALTLIIGVQLLLECVQFLLVPGVVLLAPAEGVRYLLLRREGKLLRVQKAWGEGEEEEG